MRGPRYLPEPSLVEITVRTIQSRFLLVLSKVGVETIVGVIARAQKRYKVKVIDVKQMRAHPEDELSPASAVLLRERQADGVLHAS